MKDDSKDVVTKKQFMTSMGKIDDKFSKIDDRFSKIDDKFNKIDDRFNKIDDKFNKIDDKFSKIDDKFSKVDDRFDTMGKIFSQRIEQLKEEIFEKMYTKEDHAKYMIWLDEAMTELRDMRDERKLGEQQIIRLNDRTIGHEKRIRILEKTIH